MADREVEDNRKRILVLLGPSAEQGSVDWLCPDCRFPVIELHNAITLGISDVIDFDSRHNTMVGVHHSGFFHDKQGLAVKCRIRYYFTLGEHS